MKTKFLKNTAIIAAALAFAGSASATCTGCVDTPPVPNNHFSSLGVTVFGGLESATASHGAGDGVGSTRRTETMTIGDELFKLGADVNYKVDAAPNCTGCGDQTARVFLNGQQKVGAGALNESSSNTGGASSRSNTGTASRFQGLVGVKWGAIVPQ